MSGVQFATESYRTGFQKKTREKMGTLGGNHICFRKSLSQTCNLIMLDFSSMSPRFPFVFVISSPQNRQLGTHTGGVQGR